MLRHKYKAQHICVNSIIISVASRYSKDQYIAVANKLFRNKGYSVSNDVSIITMYIISSASSTMIMSLRKYKSEATNQVLILLLIVDILSALEIKSLWIFIINVSKEYRKGLESNLGRQKANYNSHDEHIAYTG
ncbi:unnamed protein product (macronuclear) [Paramecium tetraurelia]|uniref:G-protein coupled receptors family 1 profile domain-containing protein n=1 Tax=Paramecium tetraurelia TaxID=5888 RepID=A0D116_PARTE|nr:uncharacterized protein GSPATT00012285001 [Paramecium tetraurelia]CAK76733.1 unnamed protein product [Paramecium tetraurelia]|eukprot:XP_001444130.1 hypothetical protein (macronuclear) [Paramecium tetraurelia strain d4-2]